MHAPDAVEVDIHKEGIQPIAPDDPTPLLPLELEDDVPEEVEVGVEDRHLDQDLEQAFQLTFQAPSHFRPLRITPPNAYGTARKPPPSLSLSNHTDNRAATPSNHTRRTPKPRPASDRDCLMCAVFARHRCSTFGSVNLMPRTPLAPWTKAPPPRSLPGAHKWCRRRLVV